MDERAGAAPNRGQGHGRSTVIGLAWLSLGRGISLIINLVTIAVLSRLLTPHDFGSVAIPLALVTLGTMLADGTFGMNLVQRSAIEGKTVGGALSLSLGLGLLLAGATAAAAPLVEWLVDIEGSARLLLLASLILPIAATTAVGKNLLQREKRFDLIVRSATAASLGYGAAATALALWGFGPAALILGALVRSMAEAVMLLTPALRMHVPRFTRSGLRESFDSAGAYTLWSLFLWSGNNIDRLVVAKMIGVFELGLYVRGMNLLQIVNGVIGTGSFRVLFSTFSRMQDDIPRLRAGVERALMPGLTVSALATGFVIIYADLLVRIILGPQWLGAIPIIQLIFLSLFARSGYQIVEAVPASLGLARANAARQASRAVLIGFGAWIGSQFGVLGAAMGSALGFWIFYVLMLVQVARLIRLPLRRLARINAMPLVVAAIPAGAAFMVRQAPAGPEWLLALASLGLFGLLTLAIVALAPPWIVGEDAGRLRVRLLARAKRLRGGGTINGT